MQANDLLHGADDRFRWKRECEDRPRLAEDVDSGEVVCEWVEVNR